MIGNTYDVCFFIAALISFLGQLPLGNMSITATQIGIQEGLKRAWIFAYRGSHGRNAVPPFCPYRYGLGSKTPALVSGAGLGNCGLVFIAGYIVFSRSKKANRKKTNQLC